MIYYTVCNAYICVYIYLFIYFTYLPVDSSDSYDPEAYNPESPGLTGPSRIQYRQFIPRIQTQRLNLIGLTSGDGQTSRGIANCIRL